MNYSEFGQACELKETFSRFGIAKLDTGHRKRITTEMRALSDLFVKAMDDWHDDIFGCFDQPITKCLYRKPEHSDPCHETYWAGQSFEALRVKFVFTEGFQKTKKPCYYQRERIPDGAMRRMQIHGVAESEQATNYGADISTLLREIEEGHL